MLDALSVTKTRILLADDHPLMRMALKKVLDTQDDFQVIAEAEDGEEAVKKAIELKPDLVILDISMPKLNGLEATRQIKARCPSIAILVLTVHSEAEYVFEILEAGAAGYLTKSVYDSEVLQAIRAVVSGESVLTPIILKGMLERMNTSQKQKPARKVSINNLSARELEILQLAANGLGNKDIAIRLNLSVRTVKSHMVTIFSKLQVGSRTEAVVTGLRSGLIVNNVGS